MSLPEKNTFFENLPAHADVRLQGPKGSQAYIHTDADGVESVVIMDGQQQREQQQILDQLCEETIGRKLYAKGYRYKCNPTSRKFDPLYVKTSTEIGPLLRTYPDERFDVHEINKRGERKVIHVCCYIPASEFFANFPEVWEELSNSDPNFTWGDNNRSLVTVERIVQHLDASHIDYPEAFEEHYKEYVPEDYIDLEN